MRVNQIQETVDYQRLINNRTLSFTPPLGQCIAMQYELEGSFNMLPIKLYPTFLINQEYRKLDLNLKIFNKLPTNLRCKQLTITFRVPEEVQRVLFKEQNLSHDIKWDQVKDVSSLGQYIAGNYWQQTPSKSGKPSKQLDPLTNENGIAEFYQGKRKIIWRLKNVKG